MNRHERRALKKRSGPDIARNRPTIEPGLVHHQAGRLAEAEACYRAVLKARPSDSQAHHLLGLVDIARGKLDDAIAHIRQAIGSAGSVPEFHGNLANALAARGDVADAIAHYDTALELRPDYAEALTNRSQTLMNRGLGTAAVRDLRRAIALLPGLGAAIGNLAEAWRRLGRPILATGWYRRALSLSAEEPGLLGSLGACLASTRRMVEAQRLTRRALALAPAAAGAHGNSAVVAAGAGPAALRSLRRALVLSPLDPGFALDLGVELMNGTGGDDALPYLARAIALRPAYAEAWNNLGLHRFSVGELDAAAAAVRRALAVEPMSVAIGRNHLQICLHLSRISARQVLDDHLDFARRHARPRAGTAAVSRTAGAPLRIGIVSTDFRAHPLGRFLSAPVAHRDPERMKVTCYADVAQQDETTEWFRTSADGWVDISSMNDEEAAARMRADGVDVLLVSAGHFDTNRPLIAAWRAAPVQISFDAATSGIAEMDYWLTDRVIHPSDASEPATERFVAIPVLYNMGFEALELPAGPRSEKPVFASFANPTRISDATVRLWSGVLSAVPEARLLLKYRDRYGSGRLRARLQAAFGAAGVDPARIDFVTTFETREEHLRRYAEVDVALDTFPFNGASTSIEALFAGVPVLTLAGDRFVSRQSSSILAGAGLHGWSAVDEADYVAKAVSAAEERHRLVTGRRQLQLKVAASRLCDGRSYARSWEDLFERLARDGAS